MNTPNELYKWLPADERLVKLLLSNAIVVLRNEDGDIGTANIELLMELCGCVNPTAEQATDALASRRIEYLPPTVPEVLELPDSDGNWWWWCAELNCWIRRHFEIKDPVAYDTWSLEKGYFIKIYEPNFNPVTGENLY